MDYKKKYLQLKRYLYNRNKKQYGGNKNTTIFTINSIKHVKHNTEHYQCKKEITEKNKITDTVNKMKNTHIFYKVTNGIQEINDINEVKNINSILEKIDQTQYSTLNDIDKIILCNPFKFEEPSKSKTIEELEKEALEIIKIKKEKYSNYLKLTKILAEKNIVITKRIQEFEQIKETEKKNKNKAFFLEFIDYINDQLEDYDKHNENEIKYNEDRLSLIHI